MIKEFDYKELEEATQGFSPTHLIGKGSHGLVYKGALQDGKLVAIKKPSPGLQILRDNTKIDNEISMLSSLPENPNIISLLGTSHDSAMNKVLVMELMPNGSLHDLLHVSTTPPTWPQRLGMAMQIARAVQFLHEEKPLVVHRDINQPAGTIGYLDPCYTTPSKLSTKNDVFSFGVVLLEVISTSKVIDLSRTRTHIVEWAIPLIKKDRIKEVCDSRTELPMCMEGTIRHILRVAARCVSSREDLRPSMQQIIIDIDKHRSIDRVRVPIWSSLLESVVLIRRGRRSASRFRGANSVKCATHKGEVGGEFARGKVLLRDVLAEIC
ncbi:unnamed protein product, partial [Vitis vinifera]